MADATHASKIYRTNSGDKLAVASGGVVDVESGGALKIAGTDKTAVLAAAVAAPVGGVAAAYKIARGQHTTLDADDTVVTGLATVVAIVASLDSDPVAGCQTVTASIGDQVAAPVAGSVFIKTWKATAAGDTDVIPATTFTKLVNWIAIGT